VSGILAFFSRRPRTALAGLIVVSILAIAGIGRLSFDSSLTSLTAPDDPARAFHAQIQKIFGDQEIGVVAIVTDDAYQPVVLEALRTMTDQIAAIPGVDRVLSLANAKDPAKDVLNPPPLIPPGPISARLAEEVRERVSANPIYVPHLAARDGGAVAANVFFARGRKDEDEPRIDRQILEIVDSYAGPGRAYYAGMSHIRVKSTELMRADLARFLPLSLLCMMAVLWISFRSVRATLLPLVSIALGVAALLGIMGWLGEPITLTTLVLPSLLLVIGGSYSVHVAAAVLAGEDGDGGNQIRNVLQRVGLPVAFSALTTAVGFGSLALHPIPAISGLGLFAVVGIAVMAFGSVFGVTLFFAATPRHRRPGELESVAASSALLKRVDELLEKIVKMAVSRRRTVFVVSGLIAAVAVVGTSRVRVDTDLLTAFRPDSEVRESYRAITDNLAGPNPVSIVITGPEPGYFKSIVPLRHVKDFQNFLEETDQIDSTISLVDYLEELDLGLRATEGDMVVNEAGEVVEAPPPPSFWDAPAEQLPAIFELVALSPQTFSGVVDSDFHRLRITARTAVSGSRDTAELAREIQGYAEVIFPPGVRVDLTGNLVVVSTVADRVLSGQIESLTLAFTVIFAVLALQFLSLRVGFAAMIPNLLPVLLFFGVMGWTGVELNLATSIIGAVALGIAVDDTIHYMSVLNRVVKTTPTQLAALVETMRIVGRPVVATSFTLIAGFSVMLVSSFGLISTFGWLSAMTMAVALVTNLVLLPALLATVPVISVWDFVTFRLGPAPNKTIPLFEGLANMSVRLVVLLGRVKSYAHDQPIVRKGDEGHEMYLVLTGSADVIVDDRVIARLRRGDVFGEMALLRQAVRSADVVARADVEVLVIDEDFLRRLRFLYPRFASRFFLNIARILSDRLEEANTRR